MDTQCFVEATLIAQGSPPLSESGDTPETVSFAFELLLLLLGFLSSLLLSELGFLLLLLTLRLGLSGFPQLLVFELLTSPLSGSLSPFSLICCVLLGGSFSTLLRSGSSLLCSSGSSPSSLL